MTMTTRAAGPRPSCLLHFTSHTPQSQPTTTSTTQRQINLLACLPSWRHPDSFLYRLVFHVESTIIIIEL